MIFIIYFKAVMQPSAVKFATLFYGADMLSLNDINIYDFLYDK